MPSVPEKTQIGIIIVAHADLGATLLRLVESILGPQSDCTSISVDAAFEASDTVQRLNDAASRLDKGAGVLVLTDMFGGTPTNLSLALLARHRLEVVTGVNLPMALKAFGAREVALEDLAALAEEAGKSGIVAAGKMLHSTKATE